MTSRISKLSIVSLDNIDECNAEDVESELEKSLQTFGVPLRQTMIGCCTMSSFVPMRYFTDQMDKSINVPLMDHVPHTNIIKMAINRIQQVYKAWSVRQVRVFKFINAYEFVKVTINRKLQENVTVFDGEPIDPIYQDVDLDDHWDYRSLYTQGNQLSIIPKAIVYYFGSTSRPLELFRLEDESSVSKWNMANGECLALFCDKVRWWNSKCDNLNANHSMPKNRIQTWVGEHCARMMEFDVWRMVAKKIDPPSCNALRKTCSELNNQLCATHRNAIVKWAVQTGESILACIQKRPYFNLITEYRLREVLHPSSLQKKDSDVFLRRLLIMITTTHLMIIQRRLTMVASGVKHQLNLKHFLTLAKTDSMDTLQAEQSDRSIKNCNRVIHNYEQRRSSLESLETHLKNRLELLMTTHVIV